MLTTVMELLGVASLVAFGFFVWPPLALCLFGVALLAGSWALERRRS